MLFSIFLAMSLTPALCATLLKPMKKGEQHEKRGPFGWFNRGFAASHHNYQSVVGRILTKAAALSDSLCRRFCWRWTGCIRRLPSSFLPEEDQGYFITAIQLPVGATQQRTLAVVKQIEAYYKKQPEISDVIAVTGFSFNGRGPKRRHCVCAFERLEPAPRRGASCAGHYRPRLDGLVRHQGRDHLSAQPAADFRIGQSPPDSILNSKIKAGSAMPD